MTESAYESSDRKLAEKRRRIILEGCPDSGESDESPVEGEDGKAVRAHVEEYEP